MHSSLFRGVIEAVQGFLFSFVKKVVMKRLYYLVALLFFGACGVNGEKDRDIFRDILDIKYTPAKDEVRVANGKSFFTDYGAWFGFTLPMEGDDVKGFCGPLDLDGRRWVSRSLCSVVGFDGVVIGSYYPGKAVIEGNNEEKSLLQELYFVSGKDALLRIDYSGFDFRVEGELTSWLSEWHLDNNRLSTHLPNGEIVTLLFPENMTITLDGMLYGAENAQKRGITYILISYYNNELDFKAFEKRSREIYTHPDRAIDDNRSRWSGYIDSNLRSDLSGEYDRVLAKSIVTLISNWRSPKGALSHSGVVPSHSMGYFVGYWAWDSWKHAVALSFIDNELAKEQIRAMFEFQDEYGMIADCVFTDPRHNNYRDTKPPLAAWAVNALYEADKDRDFLAEIYPALVKYHNWWYSYRDHDSNGICEYGATDGTLEAAKWESGMDNAVRFDATSMLKNGENAWSMDQESVDLNVYLWQEAGFIEKFAKILGIEADTPKIDTEMVRSYFFEEEIGYFFDRKISDGSFIEREGPEGWSPLWTEIATKEQAERVICIMRDTSKFSTYIPFPTVAADDPEFNVTGYWRGPIWLDQVYFAISAMRKYGYDKEADRYTLEVFDRLEGLKEGLPIHENYDPHTGKRLKASNFSWSAVHLFLLYKELYSTI